MTIAVSSLPATGMAGQASCLLAIARKDMREVIPAFLTPYMETIPLMI